MLHACAGMGERRPADRRLVRRMSSDQPTEDGAGIEDPSFWTGAKCGSLPVAMGIEISSAPCVHACMHAAGTQLCRIYF